MYKGHWTVAVKIEKVCDFIEIYQKRSRFVDEYVGFRSFRLMQNETVPHELTVEICWDAKEHYLKYITSDAYKKVHELEKNYPDQELAAIKPRVQRFTQVAE